MASLFQGYSVIIWAAVIKSFRLISIGDVTLELKQELDRVRPSLPRVILQLTDTRLDSCASWPMLYARYSVIYN
jgi:hypothetical protein